MAKAELFQKEMPKEERVFYYESEEDDPIKTDEQEKNIEVKLPEDYVFIQRNPFRKLYQAVLYRSFRLFARWYAKYYLDVTVVGRDKLKKAKGRGYVVYANHTHPYHDAFSPAVVVDRHIYTIMNPVGLLLPGIGKFLPALGAIPLGSTKEQKKAMNEAVDERLRQKNCLVIYPEAHVWPYYTGIRKFPAGDRSFKYPVRNGLPIFTMTTTYQKSRKKGQERPRMTVYLDGPFWPDENLSDAENQAKLAAEAYDSMKKWAKKSNYEYIKYIRKTAGK